MRFIWNAAEKDLRRYLRDPMALVLWLGVPLLVGGLITLAMGGGNRTPPTAHLLVADEDGSVLSNLLARAFGPNRNGQILRVEQVTRTEGRRRLDRGEASALLVIPNGFTDAVLNEKPTTLLLVTNPAQRILPQIIREGLEILADGTFYVHRVLGAEVREIVQGPSEGNATFSNEDIARISVSINDVVGRLQKYLLPPVIELETSVDQQEPGEQVSLAKLFLPGIMFMALVFMAEGLSVDVWRERDGGTLRRAACAPSSVAVLLAGKLLASTLVIFAGALIVLFAGMLYLDMSLSKLPLALVWTSLSGVMFLLLSLVIQIHASTQRAGTVLINALVMPLLFVGGSFFPFEAMPGWMAAIGQWTPNGWALKHLKDILFDREDPAWLVAALTALVVISAILFLLGERRMRRVFARS